MLSDVSIDDDYEALIVNRSNSQQKAVTPEPQVIVPKIDTTKPEPTKIVNQLNSLNDDDDTEDHKFQEPVSDNEQAYYEEDDEAAPGEPESVDRNPLIRIDPSRRI